MTQQRSRPRRKLLVATLGVAAVNYVACGGSTSSVAGPRDARADIQSYDVVANLVAPPVDASDAKDVQTDQGSLFDVVANLVAPPVDASKDAPKDQGSLFDVVANLVPPPIDGGQR